MRELQSLIDGYQSTCILAAAVQLGIFEALEHRPQAVATLVERLDVDADGLSRLLRVLRSYGLITLDHGELQLTSEGRLCAPAGGGLADYLRVIAGEYLAVWQRLSASVVGGKPVFRSVFGETPWEHRGQNPSLGEAFNRMVERSQCAAADRIIAAYDFSRYSRIVDVGGGRGHLLSRILAAHAEVSGVLFDLHQVAAIARDWLQRSHHGDRFEIQEGSFFERVPADANLYILQYVLHDWDDERCDVILRNCRAAMRETSRLLILEKPLPRDDTVDDFRWLAIRDLHMMLVHGGRERTLEQYESLLKAASFHPTTHLRLDGHLPDVIEARPVN